MEAKGIGVHFFQKLNANELTSEETSRMIDPTGGKVFHPATEAVYPGRTEETRTPRSLRRTRVQPTLSPATRGPLPAPCFSSPRVTRQFTTLL